MANAKISELPVLQKLGNTGAAPSASRNWDFAYTWNSGGTTFSADFMNITDTASAAGSLVFERQVGGATIFGVRKDGAFGRITTSGRIISPISQSGNQGFGIGLFNNGESRISLGPSGVGLNSALVLWWTASASDGNATADTGQARKAAGVSENNNGTKGSYTGSAFGSGSQTVAQLPAAATAGKGARSFVTDATATTFLSTVAGGGANNVPVVSDGTNWLIG